MEQDLKEKNKKVLTIVLSVIILMVGLAYASVPLYDLFCRVTGFGGTTQVATELPDQILDRTVKVNFITSTSKNMPWNFKAETRSVELNIGQNALVNFIAENPTSQPITGTAIYNVTPLKAGKYFHKTQCFCFDRQTLLPKQEMNMPVVFFVDPEIQDDPNMDDVEVITLSYTFFKSDSQELEKAMQDYGE